MKKKISRITIIMTASILLGAFFTACGKDIYISDSEEDSVIAEEISEQLSEFPEKESEEISEMR